MTMTSSAADYSLPSPIAEEDDDIPSSDFFPTAPLFDSDISPVRDSGSRRGSQNSMTGYYGGLPPLDQSNPRRGSATGSYGIPVPPDWLRNRNVVATKSGSLLGLSGSGGGRDSPTPAEKRLKRPLKPLNLGSSHPTINAMVVSPFIMKFSTIWQCVHFSNLRTSKGNIAAMTSILW